MRKIVSILIVAAFVTVAAPQVSASETDSGEYAVGSGFFISGVLGLAASCGNFCLTGEILDVEDETGIPPIESPITDEQVPYDMGGIAYSVEGSYNALDTEGLDLLFGPQMGMSSCFFHPDGDNVCQESDNPADNLDGLNDVQSDWSCGPNHLNTIENGYGWTSSTGNTFALGLVITEDTNICGATTGSLKASFYDIPA